MTRSEFLERLAGLYRRVLLGLAPEETLGQALRRADLNATEMRLLSRMARGSADPIRLAYDDVTLGGARQPYAEFLP